MSSRSCRAVVSREPWGLELASVPVVEDLAGGGVGRVLAAGVCGTDLELFGDASLARRIRPVVLGHENVVLVEECDDLLTARWGVHPGDRVLVEEYIPCGHCPVCRAGRYRVCPRTDFHSAEFLRYGRMSLCGPAGPWGGFAELLYLHPDAALHPVPAALSDEHATLAVPFANAIRWLRDLALIGRDSRVLVLGPGALGLACAAVALDAGAAVVGIAGLVHDVARLDVGRSLGARLITLEGDDLDLGRLQAVFDRSGPDVVVDTTGGSGSAVGAAITAAAPGATVLLPSPVPLSADAGSAVTRGELSLRGVRGHDGEGLARALALLSSGRIDVGLLTAPPVPLAGAAAALAAMTRSTSDRPVHLSIAPQS